MTDRNAPRPAPPAETTFDLAYLLAEIEELQRLAKGMGLGTLDYLLEMAAIEGRHQATITKAGREQVAEKKERPKAL
jgi:hypothetical protein